MKKIIISIYALLCATFVMAYDFSVNGIFYNILEDNAVEVTYNDEKMMEFGDCYSGDVIIPATVTYNGTTYNVTTIGNMAFFDANSLQSISLPDGITTIGNEAICDCPLLTSITFPATVTSLGTSVGDGCSKLFDIYIYATVPPATPRSGSFSIRTWSYVTLHVPCESLEAYKADKNYNLIEKIVCIENTAVDNIHMGEKNAQKLFQNGQLVIQCDDKSYNALGGRK